MKLIVLVLHGIGKTALSNLITERASNTEVISPVHNSLLIGIAIWSIGF